jgi:hypothetical protein
MQHPAGPQLDTIFDKLKFFKTIEKVFTQSKWKRQASRWETRGQGFCRSI